MEINELVTAIDKWTYFIKHAEELSVIPDYANDDEGLKEAFVEADKHNWSKDDLIAYDNASIWEGDQQQERERVIQKAKEEERIETILKLHKKRKSAEEISDLLDIPLEEVREVIEKASIK